MSGEKSDPPPPAFLDAINVRYTNELFDLAASQYPSSLFSSPKDKGALESHHLTFTHEKTFQQRLQDKREDIAHASLQSALRMGVDALKSSQQDLLLAREELVCLREELAQYRLQREEDRRVILSYELPLKVAKAIDRKVSNKYQWLRQYLSNPHKPEHLTFFTSFILNIFVYTLIYEPDAVQYLPGHGFLVKSKDFLYDLLCDKPSVQYFVGNDISESFRRDLASHLSGCSGQRDPLMDVGVLMRIRSLEMAEDCHEPTHVKASKVEVEEFLLQYAEDVDGVDWESMVSIARTINDKLDTGALNRERLRRLG
ncbi:hypothetical protein VKT23_009040 [Stygiomarasmius scandens]|uniref:Uncharacterized protein n=1 Tax=Marasmiellus scandens TaxID=2682957 RepID=A0ABR1JIV0_9AGAR